MIGPSCYGRFRVLVTQLAILAVFARIASADDLVKAPQGYSSRAAITLAIELGQLKLIDTKIDGPETVTVRKDVQYGTAGQLPLLLDLYQPIDDTGYRVKQMLAFLEAHLRKAPRRGMGKMSTFSMASVQTQIPSGPACTVIMITMFGVNDLESRTKPREL